MLGPDVALLAKNKCGELCIASISSSLHILRSQSPCQVNLKESDTGLLGLFGLDH
jgi:hypothetical protein